MSESLQIEPSTTMTFTIVKAPKAEAARKTLVRLMQMQPEIKKGLSMLKVRRDREDNIKKIRGGRPWTSRAKAAKLVNVADGATFTLRVTPQIVPDLKSVGKYLSAAPASA
ncbi:MAG: hypothetical protein ACYTFH_09730 [Planctomycetota bacterium]|jgi:hypothetical protein